MSDTKVIIIGAGLGGLVTGALLAKEGMKVTIVEKNHRVGGGLQSYKRFDTIFDTGMHIFGGMDQNGNIKRLCKYLNIEDKFQVVDLDKDNDIEVFVESDNKKYDFGLNAQNFLGSLSEHFPAEAQNLSRYKEAIERIMQKFDLFFLRPSNVKYFSPEADFIIPADAFISKYIYDERLQALLAIVNTLYAGERNISPAFLHAAISTIFMNGACRIAGGYSTFADALVSAIKQHGGQIITAQPVKSILSANNLITGIQTHNGLNLNADCLISAIPLSSMLDLMEDNTILSNAYQTAVRAKDASNSAFIVNIKLKKDKFKYSNRIGFYLQDYSSVWTAYNGGSVSKLMYMTPPVKGQGEFAETLNIIVPMKWEVVERWADTKPMSRGKEYIAFKDNLLQNVLNKLSLIIPEIHDIIEDVDTASPLTIRDYTGVVKGAMCGDRKDCNDPLAFMPVTTRIPNLFVTGQNVNMHGFCGVTLTAIQTCEAILGKDFIVNKINNQA